MKNKNSKGITLVEILIVVGVVAILALAMYPLIETTYTSWRHADRRTELLQIGRVGMDKMTREIRKAYDLYSCTDSLYIDFYPDWASDTVFRFNWNNATDLEYGTQTPVFINDSLVAPVVDFDYTTYTRQMNTGVTRARQVNAFRIAFKVTDERDVLPTTAALNLNPMEFRSHVQMRVSREGWMISRTNAFASETYQFKRNEVDEMGDSICVKAFCDRISDPTDMVPGQTIVTTKTSAGGLQRSFFLAWQPNGDYFWVCLFVHDPVGDNDLRPAGALPPLGRYRVEIEVTENGSQESCNIRDSLWVVD